ncbi:MAG: TonB-dependent receptor [Gammaproteobacteria bacterium]|nr:TonB-dependent receptor [Gammaproteobacteria bacterium]MBQ0775817.1 TonB-dependent receptor [Gammaproteobacteria bacterium]
MSLGGFVQKLLGLLAAVALAQSAAAAESLSFDGDALRMSDAAPVVLTPARLRQPQSQAPASVTVIDRELIEASGAREIYQLMQLVPGMAALKVDGNIPTVSYHGTQARDVRRMLVMIDGRSQYKPGLARVLWNDLPIEIEDIERIEVTRGPASAAYGANAFQGVINIITRHPDDVVGTTLAARQGNNGVRDWRVTTAAHGDGKSVRLTVAEKSDDGYDGTYYDDDPLVMRDVAMRDAKRIKNINLRSAFDLGSDDTLEFLAGGSESGLQRLTEDSDFYEVLEVYDAPDEHAEQAFAQMIWNHRFSAKHELKVQAYAQYNSNNLAFGGCAKLPGGAADSTGAVLFSKEMRDLYEANGRDINATIAQLGSSPEIGARFGALVGATSEPLCADFDLRLQEERYDLEIQDTIYIDEYARLVVGGNLRHDRGYSKTYTNGVVENVSQRLFGNLELHLADPLYLNLGGYWERDERNGRYFSPRTSLIYEFMPSNSLRLVASDSIRSMDLYEDAADVHLYPTRVNEPYASDPVGLLGQDRVEFFIVQTSHGELTPERIRSREIGYFGRYRSVEWDIRVYDEELRDLVSGSLSPFNFDPENDGEVDINGREVQLSWRVSARHLLRATGAHRHTDANNKPELRLASRNSASLLWRWDINDNWMFSTSRYLGSDYNKLRYERTDGQITWKARLSDSEVMIGALVQHDLTNNEVVFEENVYRDDTRYWLSAAVTF